MLCRGTSGHLNFKYNGFFCFIHFIFILPSAYLLPKLTSSFSPGIYHTTSQVKNSINRTGKIKIRRVSSVGYGGELVKEHSRSSNPINYLSVSIYSHTHILIILTFADFKYLVQGKRKIKLLPSCDTIAYP